MPRSNKQPILYQNELNIPEKYLRFSTPKEVAIYRAERLNCNKIVEIGSGIGGQTMAFSCVCKQVLAIEIDKIKANILIQNLKKLKLQNVEVLHGNALANNIIQKIEKFKPDIIFIDTERPEQAERTIGNIQPPISKILSILLEITPKIAIEIPPLTKNLEDIKSQDFEKEFISLNKQLNRLTLYFNELKQNEISAISLPSKEKIIKSYAKENEVSSLKGYKYLYVINPTISVAGLIKELSEKFASPIAKLDKPMLLSNKELNSSFLTGYRILAICKNEHKEILESLRKLDAGKVVIRYSISPESYWETRNFYEKNLKGNKEVNLFADEKKNKAILTEKV